MKEYNYLLCDQRTQEVESIKLPIFLNIAAVFIYKSKYYVVEKIQLDLIDCRMFHELIS